MLITDLDTIKRKAEEANDENWEFRAFLKGELEWDGDVLDAYVYKIAREVSDQIDCTACGNCCRITGTGVNGDEIAGLARHMRMSTSAFKKRYVGTDDCGDVIIKETPCPFLEGNLCRIYDDRPRNCREYPYLLKEGFRQRLIGVVYNASDCPIVFNTYEILKKRFRQPD